MFFSFFKVVYYFHFSIFLSLFDIKLFDVKLYHAGISLKKKSFRFLSESYRDNLITLRIFKAIWLKSFDNTRAYIKLNNDSKEAVFDIHNSSFDIRIEYVQKLSKKDMGFFIAKSNLLFIDNYLQKALVLLYLIIVFIPVFFISIISKNKVSAPLFVQELIEAFNLLVLLKKEKIKKVHYFCIYERDANLCAYVLMKNGFIVNKIPSEVPLVFANKVIVANQLSFCFGYQQEEFFYYKDTMFIDSTQQWLPELFFKTPINILSSSIKNSEVIYEIGFFSSGNWLRDKLGDVDLGTDDFKNENSILNILVNFVCQNNLKMCIFLHPIEKKTVNLNFSLKNYELLLKNKNITIADINESSINGFDKISIGIAQCSTIMFERIVLGYKTIIAPWGHSNFPIKNSTLSNCCALNESELIKKLNEFLPISINEYFIKTDLNKYVHNYKF